MSRRRSTRRLRQFVLPLFVLLALAVPALANAAPTVVSLTFDDGRSDQYAVRSTLDAHGMDGTFFVNSNDHRRCWAPLLGPTGRSVRRRQ